jgi:hypothetical protein
LEQALRYRDQQALIIGAGLDGLLAARVLIEHFRQVTVISPHRPSDQTALPETIWQALPSHILAVQGYRVLERLFPGLTAELMVAGAPTIEWTADAVTLLPGGWAPRFHSDLISRPVTDALLVHLVRQRLQDYAGGRVTFLDERSVLSVQTSPAPKLTVEYTGTPETLTADLLVDASGRRDQFPTWLIQAGLPLPECTTIAGYMGLSARLYRRPPGYQPGWQAVLVVAHDGQAGGALIPVEGGRWLALAVAAEAPESEAAFMNLMRNLRTPILYDAIQRGLPLTPVFSLQKTESSYWHFERLMNWPDTLIVSGTMNFNPAYGFDLTASTLAALALRDALEDQRKRHADGRLNGLSQRYYERLVRASALPRLWMNAEAAKSGLGVRAARWYGDHLLAAAQAEPQVYQALMAAVGLAAPARTLLVPSLLAQVFRRATLNPPFEMLPPMFEPSHVHKTITQEIASVAGSKDRLS